MKFEAHRLSLAAAVVAGALGACVDDAAMSSGTVAAERESRGPHLIQPGSDLMLLAVSDDNYAVYQAGQTVYASKLAAGADQTFVADVPDGSIAFPLQVGNVVFVWTSPQRNLPGFGVSPLVLWTSEHGPVVISPQSAVGLVATAASPDSQQIVFTTNVTDDGLRGDLVYARTRQPLSPTTLLHDIPLDFPFGTCRPLAGFAGSDGDAFPIAAYCAGSDTTATLSTWVRGNKRDLIANIATPMPFFFGSDPQQQTFLVNLADTTVATVTTSGHVHVLDSTVLGSAGFINQHGTVGYVATTPGPPELRLALRGHTPAQPVSPFVGMPVESYNRGGYSIRQTTSLDGSLAQFASVFDPATGFTDVKLLDLANGTSTVLEPSAIGAFGSELYTSDSKLALYFTLPDPTASTGELFAGNRAGSHQIGTSAGVFDVLRAAGSTISYSDNPIFDSTRAFFASTADLVVADADNAACAPHVVSATANLFYFPSHDRRSLVFTTEHETDGPGLYLATASAH